MNTDDFWSLIERAQQVADPQNEASMMEALFWELTRLPDRDFFAWYRLQQAFMQLADTPKLCAAASIINYGTSDDRFMDFRAWLVMQGRAVYLSALAAPDRLARMRVPFGEAEWELCGYIAMYAYTGRKYLAADTMWVGLAKTWNTRCCRQRSSTGCSAAISPGISSRPSTKANLKRIWLKNWPRRSPSIPQKWTQLCRMPFLPCGRSGQTGNPAGCSNEAALPVINRLNADCRKRQPLGGSGCCLFR